jgi:pentose-5-phosphate-3-epimerase
VAEVDGTAHRAEMHEGLKSQFDVIVDGRTVFSKQRTGRFPYPGEVPGLLRPD